MALGPYPIARSVPYIQGFCAELLESKPRHTDRQGFCVVLAFHPKIGWM